MKVEKIYPLTSMQEGILFQALSEPDSRAYYEQLSFEIQGHLSPELWEESFNLVMLRHPTLRAIFVHEKIARPRMVIVSGRQLSVQWEDLRSLETGEAAERLRIISERDAYTSYRFSKDLMMRVTVARQAEDRYTVIWSHHHILMDGWCTGIVISEWLQAYSALLQGQTPALPPPADFQEYMDWRALRNEVTDNNYWKQYLAGYEAVAAFPKLGDRTPELKADRLEVVLPAAVVEPLSTLAKAERTSLNTVIQAAWATMLQSYAQAEDVVFGAVISGRPAEVVGIQQMVGLFINTIPVRVQAEAETTFVDVLAKVQEDAFDSLQHGHVPLAEIQANSPLKKELFDHILVFENYPVDPSALAGVPGPKGFQIIGSQQDEATNFGLTVIMRAQEELSVQFLYDPAEYSAFTVGNIAAHFEAVLRRVAIEPKTSIGRLQALPQTQIDELLAFGGTPAKVKACANLPTVLALFEQQAAQNPETVALICGDMQWTYSELDRKANAVANHLHSNFNLQPGDCIGIMTHVNCGLLAGMLGILKTGAAYLPINPAYPIPRIRFMLQDSGAKAFLTEAEWTTHTDAGCPAIDIEKISWDQTAALSQKPEAGDLAYVIYTSGSTGQPKGVLLSHYNISRLFTATQAHFQFDETDVWALFHSFAFDFSVWEIWGPLIYGGKLVVIPTEIVQTTPLFLEELHRTGVTVLNQTPTAFQHLIVADQEHRGESELQLRWVIFGGEALSVASLRPWVDKYGWEAPRLVNMYGITETTVHVTLHELTAEDIATSRDLIGCAMEDLQVLLLDDNLNPVPAGVAAEIHVAGAGLARGYLNRPEITLDRFVVHPFLPGEKLYRSGDWGRVLPHGGLEYLGRMDQQMKIRGFRVEAAEIENALMVIPGIRGASVLAKKSLEEAELYAFLVATPGEKIPAIPDLREILAVNLPAYMIPARFIELESFPMTGNGKVNRAELLGRDWESVGSGSVFEAPQGTFEKGLAAIWEEVLAHPGIGRDDDFFDLGGHSLKAVRIMARAKKDLATDLRLGDIFGLPTIRQLAEKYTISTPAVQEEIPRLGDQTDYAVSHGQRRLWVLDKLEGPNAVYNVPGAMRLEGEPDLGALQAAFQFLSERHEGLRTGFRQSGQHVRQFILNAQTVLELPVTDLRAQPDPEATAGEWVLKEAMAPFDLAQPPLIRLRLLLLGEQDAVLSIVLHHIVCDGLSLAVLLQEFQEYYASFRSGTQPQAVPLRIRYRDFVAWQNASLNDERTKALGNYWKSKFADAIPVIQLPLDHARPAVKQYAGARQTFQINGEGTLGLINLAKRENATLFMALNALVKTLLYRYTGQKALVLGTPVSGRSALELEGQVGFFVNTLALYDELVPENGFTALLRQVRDTSLAAYQHQDYPFDQLVEELAVERDLSRSPVFDVMLVVHEAVQAPFSLEGLKVGSFVTDEPTSKFDLTFEFAREGESISATIEYDTGLFFPEKIARMAESLLHLLQEILARPGAALHKLPLMSEEAQKELLAKAHGPLLPLPDAENIPGLLMQAAGQNPNSVAVRFGENSLTFQALDEMSNQLGNLLQSNGVGRGDVVGILMQRSEWMLVALLGILKSGAAYVALDPAYPTERIAYMLEDSGTSVVLSNSEIDFPQTFAGKRIDLDESTAFGTDVQVAPSQTRPDDLAYILFTSGSTGRPKGVQISHRNVLALLAWCRHEFDTQDFDIAYAVTSICFDLSVFELFYPLSVGKPVRIVASGLDLRREMRADQNILLNTVPSLIDALMKQGELFPNVALLNMAGEPIPARVLSGLKDEEIVIRNLYGPSEDTTYSTAYRFRRTDSRSLIGRPIGNTWVYLMDGNGALVPEGLPGEIYLSGDGVARGYLDRPDLNREKFLPDPFRSGAVMYRTGDLAKWLPDNQLEFLGRIDQQIKVRGFRIEPGEIERRILNHPEVEDVAVSAPTDQHGVRYLVAWYTCRRPVDAAELEAHLGKSLPAYMVPTSWVRLDAMPMTPNGKLDRKALLVPKAGETAAENPGRKVESTAEIKVAVIWTKLLGREVKDAKADFFALGGNSLLLLSLRSALEQAFEVDISPAALFRTRVLQAQAALMTRMQQIGSHVQADSAVLLNADSPQKIFAFPPLFGDSMIYGRLAEAMPDFAVYGFNFYMSNDRLERYVAAIRELQPSGPYRLMGYSAGGNLAFRVAKALENSGLNVASVVLLDSTRTEKALPITEEEARNYVDRLLHDFSTYFEGAYLMEPEFMKRVRTRIQGYYQYMEGVIDAGHCKADVTLIASTNTSPEVEARRQAWKEVFGGNFSLLRGAGIHAEMMSADNAEQNAALLKQALTNSTVSLGKHANEKIKESN